MTQSRFASFVAGLLAIAAAHGAAFGAGQVQFVSGSVKIVSAAGSESVPAKGARVAEGDSVATGQDSMAQIKMRDGATLVVQSNTLATVEVFRYAGVEDGNERFVLRIHRGGIRGITGAVGRTNKQNYRLETPIAQMGVRGTDHESYFFPASASADPAAPRPGAYNKVNVGGMYLRTTAGEVAVQPNQVAYVASADGVPGLLPNMPEFFHRAAGVRVSGRPAPEGMPAFVIAGNGEPGVIQTVQFGGGLSLSDPGSLPAPGPGASATVVAYVEPVGGADFGRSGTNLSISPNGSALVDTGNDAPLGVNWGSWQGPVTVSGNPTAGWAHFASAASSTSPAQLAAMPATLVSATYSYAGGPAPTNQTGVQGTVNALAATVNFSSQTITNYALNATVDGRTWAATGNGSFSQFAGSSGINLNGSCNTCSGGGGPAGANGQAHGVFVGNTAQGMLTSFGLKSAQHAVSGAALLKR